MKELTKRILKENGWYEGRKINIENFIKYYEEAEVEVFEPVKRFLEEFGGLTINVKVMQDYLNNDVSIYTTEINPINPLLPYSVLGADDIEELAHEKMLKVGTMQNGMYRIAISESGKVYFDDGLIADNIDDALDIICVKDSKKMILFNNF